MTDKEEIHMSDKIYPALAPYKALKSQCRCGPIMPSTLPTLCLSTTSCSPLALGVGKGPASGTLGVAGTGGPVYTDRLGKKRAIAEPTRPRLSLS